jgi:hypothetical protein
MGGFGYYWEPCGVGRVCEAVDTVPGSGSKVLLPRKLAELGRIVELIRSTLIGAVE